MGTTLREDFPVGVDALRFAALGGRCELYAVGSAEPLAATAEWILSMHRRLTRFDPSSELSRFNARAGEWVEVSDVLHELLEEALVAYETSGGLVHAGVLPALVAAGYDRTFAEVQAREGTAAHELREFAWDPCRSARDRCRTHQVLTETSPSPSNDLSNLGVDRCSSAVDRCTSRHALHETPASALGVPESSDFLEVVSAVPIQRPLPPLPDLLKVRPGAARLRPGAAIDLGGIAKGWIADRAVERMGANSLANCAGDLMARGSGPQGDGRTGRDGPTGDRGWPVRFSDRTLLLEDMAAATSGTTKRRWGPRSHHIIDPRTGHPAEIDLREVSIVARSALDAEVLAKAALLLGSTAAPAYLEGRALGWALVEENGPALMNAHHEGHAETITPVRERVTA